MRALTISSQIAAFVTLLFFIACMPPTNKFSSVWKDETYQERPKKVLVISAFKFPANRKLFEDDFVEVLKDRGIDAVVSYNVMPNPVVNDQDAIAHQAYAVGADAVLVNSPLDDQDELDISGGILFGESYLHSRTYVYDMKTNRMVFGATSESWIQKNKPYTDQIKSYVRELSKVMSKNRLI